MDKRGTDGASGRGPRRAPLTAGLTHTDGTDERGQARSPPLLGNTMASESSHLADQNSASWNPTILWLRRLAGPMAVETVA